MRYLDVCSGISAPTAAWKPLGWKAACFAEIEAAPRAVLSHHYPDVPLAGDFTEIRGDEYGPVDLLVGGTPCQSFSIAGLRGGLGDDRGNLALKYLRLADRARPRWLVWENVPGVLSSNGGRDFGAILGGMVELGYGVAYRVLDAQHFGVPQRRRRVFVVGYLGDWRRAAAVLFERHGLQGHPPPRREKGQRIAERTARSVAIRGRDGTPQAELGGEVANAILTPNGGRAGIGCGAVLDSSSGDLWFCLNAGGMGRQDHETETLIAHSLRAEGFDASEDGTGRGTPLVPVCVHSDTIDRSGEASTPSPDAAGRMRLRDPGLGVLDDGTAYNLTAAKPHAICFTAKDHGADAGELSPTLRAGGHSGSHANAGVMPAVAFMENQQGQVWLSETFQALNKGGGKPGQGYSAIFMGDGNGRLDDGTLSCPQDMSAGALRTLCEAASRGSPQERRLAGQSARELDAALSKLSHQGASPEEALHHLRATPEGARLLQQASAALQALGRPDAGQDEPEHPRSAVRRLTPRECERLQGFPDDFTLVPYRKGMMADGPRYKMLGNSMAVPVVRWIGERIEMVEAICAQARAA